MPRRSFTLVEILVVIALVALLIGILLPSLGQARLAARATSCGTRLAQIGVGLTLYFGEFDQTLPQLKGPLPGGGQAVIGALFSGKKGSLPLYGINDFGPERRPLNRYVLSRDVPPDSDSSPFELDEFRSPADRGARTVPGLGDVASYYHLVGASYTLNDHTLDGEAFPTLVPRTPTGDGGRMPYVLNPSRTWAVATHPIYNYQEGGDRGSFWFDRARCEANLLFVDCHVRIRARVPPGVVNTTDDYTFLP